MLEYSLVANHLWQSTIFAAVAGLLTLALRKNHARTRHAVWLAASVKFLVPFALLVGIGSHLGWRATRVETPAKLPFAIVEMSQPFAAHVTLPSC
jgi:bla regulator protein BlaR1